MFFGLGLMYTVSLLVLYCELATEQEWRGSGAMQSSGIIGFAIDWVLSVVIMFGAPIFCLALTAHVFAKPMDAIGVVIGIVMFIGCGVAAARSS